MKTLAEALPNPSDSTKPQTKQSQKYSPRRMEQLKALLIQSYDSLNIFGRDPEAIKNQIITFSEALEDQELDDITEAFRAWLKTSDKLPAPANIRSLCMDISRERREKQEWQERRRNKPQIEYRPAPMVSWAYKEWKDFTDEDKAGLRTHLAGMEPKQRLEYAGYLAQMCKVPAKFLEVA